MDVLIVDDDRLEQIESLFVALTRTVGLDDRITLNPVDGEIRIIDEDGTFYLLYFRNQLAFLLLHLQWLLWVWRRRSTLCLRMVSLLNCVP